MSRPIDPTIALRLSLRRHLRFGDTRSHSRFVQRTKWILPTLAVTLLLLVGTWPEIKGIIDRLHFSVPRIDLSEARNLRMVDPRYTGIDRDNRPYVLTAAAATQASQSDDIVSLDAPRADMTTNSGNWVEISTATSSFIRTAATSSTPTAPGSTSPTGPRKAISRCRDKVPSDMSPRKASPCTTAAR
jgi:hypothetical protein